MSLVVLDTDVASFSLRNRLPDQLRTALAGNTMCITFVTVGELMKWRVLRSWGPSRTDELARRVRQQHERITLTRNGEPEAVLVSVDDLEGLEMTLEILGDTDAVARISESLTALGRGEPGADLATVRQDLARRRATGA